MIPPRAHLSLPTAISNSKKSSGTPFPKQSSLSYPHAKPRPATRTWQKKLFTLRLDYFSLATGASLRPCGRYKTQTDPRLLMKCMPSFSRTGKQTVPEHRMRYIGPFRSFGCLGRLSSLGCPSFIWAKVRSVYRLLLPLYRRNVISLIAQLLQRGMNAPCIESSVT